MPTKSQHTIPEATLVNREALIALLAEAQRLDDSYTILSNRGAWALGRLRRDLHEPTQPSST